MKTLAQDALVELFRTMERLTGKAPSNAAVFAAARSIGFRFVDRDAKTLLAQFRATRPGDAPEPPPDGSADDPESTHKRPSPTPAPPIFHTNLAGATHARGKGTPSSNPERERETGAGARDPERAWWDREPAKARPLTEPFGLADWLWGEAARRGLLGEHHARGRDREVRADVKDAGALLATYSLDEIRRRADRFLTALEQHEVQRSPTARSLFACWEYGCVSGERPRDRAQPALVGASNGNGFVDLDALQ